MFDRDESIRADTTPETLRALKPCVQEGRHA
jgi:acetyl-CoA acetyltransferase